MQYIQYGTGNNNLFFLVIKKSCVYLKILRNEPMHIEIELIVVIHYCKKNMKCFCSLVIKQCQAMYHKVILLAVLVYFFVHMNLFIPFAKNIFCNIIFQDMGSLLTNNTSGH